MVQAVEGLSPDKQAGYCKARKQFFKDLTEGEEVSNIPIDSDVGDWMAQQCEIDTIQPTQYCKTHWCKAHKCPPRTPQQSPSGPELTQDTPVDDTPLTGIITISDSETEEPDDFVTPIKKKQKTITLQTDTRTRADNPTLSRVWGDAQRFRLKTFRSMSLVPWYACVVHILLQHWHWCTL